MFFHGVHLLQDNSRSSKASLDKRFPATPLVKTAAYAFLFAFTPLQPFASPSQTDSAHSAIEFS